MPFKHSKNAWIFLKAGYSMVVQLLLNQHAKHDPGAKENPVLRLKTENGVILKVLK